ncbi:MAG: hypothetical protein ACRDD8_06030 [Bacteroidales bacterium]
MARSIKTIANEIIKEKNKRLELSELQNDSKVSVFNGWAWIVGTVIHSLEVTMDLFMNDIADAVNTRINGTPSFYVNAMLSYQDGDELSVYNDGMSFGYETIDENKRIITQASYQENPLPNSQDRELIIKAASGSLGALTPLSPDQLIRANAYVNDIKFAGTNVKVVSRKGDIAIPRFTVFHDGSVNESDLLIAINECLNKFIMEVNFDSCIYTSKLMDAIKSIKHITDVYVDPEAVPEQGLFLVSFNEDETMMPIRKVNRVTYTEAGYMRESTKTGDEKNIPNFSDSITLKVDAK